MAQPPHQPTRRQSSLAPGVRRPWSAAAAAEASAWIQAGQYPGATSEATNRLLLRKIYWACPAGYAVDHIGPLRRGGAHAPENLQYLHAPGSASKAQRKVFGRDPEHPSIRALDHPDVGLSFDEMLAHPFGPRNRGSLVTLWVRYFDGLDARLHVDDAGGRRIYRTKIEAAAAREGGALALTPSVAARHPDLWVSSKAFEADLRDFEGPTGLAQRAGPRSGRPTRIFVDPEARGRARKLIYRQIGSLKSFELPDLLDSLTVD